MSVHEINNIYYRWINGVELPAKSTVMCVMMRSCHSSTGVIGVPNEDSDWVNPDFKDRLEPIDKSWGIK